jgi:AmiR/NasT family two-component response regulator
LLRVDDGERGRGQGRGGGQLISRIVQEAACPVIAIVETSDPDFGNEAAKRGVFAYITDGDPEELQSAIDIVLRRFVE